MSFYLQKDMSGSPDVMQNKTMAAKRGIEFSGVLCPEFFVLTNEVELLESNLKL